MKPTLRIRNISRGAGQSAVRASAYCGRRRLYDERQKKSFDFSRRPGLVYSSLRLPTHSPERLRDTGVFWNALEKHLTRANARLAREVILILPPGQPLCRHIALVQGFLEEEFVVRGHGVECAIHYDKPRNPHAHALVSFPTISASGFGPADKAWDRRAWLVGLHAIWRRHWVYHGFTCCGGGAIASIHLGQAHALMRRGIMTRQAQRLSAQRALMPRRKAHRWPPWLRLRLRRLTHTQGLRRALTPPMRDR